MRQEDGPSRRRDLLQNLLRVHSQSARINIGKYRLESVLQDGRDIRDPGERRYNDFARSVDYSQGAHRQQVCRRTRVEKDTMANSEPLAPLAFECCDL